MSADQAAAGPHAIAGLIDAIRGAVTVPELLDLAGVMALTSQSKSSIYRGIAEGKFPPPVDTPSGRRWKRRSVLMWVEKLR